MAFREVAVFEVREALRLSAWAARRGVQLSGWLMVSLAVMGADDGRSLRGQWGWLTTDADVTALLTPEVLASLSDPRAGAATS